MIFGNEQQELDDFDCEEKVCDEIPEYKYKEQALYAINLLRYAHAIVVVLQAASYGFDNYTPSLKEKVQVQPEAGEGVGGLEITGTPLKPQAK